jgi:hypothetical protein
MTDKLQQGCITPHDPVLSLPEKCSLPIATVITPVSDVQNNPIPDHPRPILKLPGQKQDLYAELIQEALIGSHPQPMIWVRPLFLVNEDQVFDLQATSDLLWPQGAFQPAYAEEVIPLMERAVLVPNANQRLQKFVQDTWVYSLGAG